MTQNNTRVLPRAAAAKALLGFAAVVAGAGPAAAQTAAPRLSFQIEERPLQKVPTTFKFQSRISQARLPVGDAVFGRILVHVKRGPTTLCSESLSNVRVRDSVLNIEIGRQMDCQLDETIASNNDLSFQICIERPENCLKPIALSTVPYAVKSSFAAVAQTAHQANEATQAHYAHRATADRSVLGRSSSGGSLGLGYYDFHTPTDEAALAGLGKQAPTPEAQAAALHEGYLQWAPVEASGEKALNVCLKGPDETLHPLEQLSLYSEETTFSGNASVQGDATFEQNLTVARNATVEGNAAVAQELAAGALRVGGGASVEGRLAARSGLELSGASSYEAGSTFTFDGDVVFKGEVTMPPGAVTALPAGSVTASALEEVDPDGGQPGVFISPAERDVSQFLVVEEASVCFLTASFGRDHVCIANRLPGGGVGLTARNAGCAWFCIK